MEIFEHLNEINKNTCVITDNDQIYSYSEIYNYCKSFSDKIANKSLVVILSSNTIGSLIGYLGCIENASVPLLLDSKLKLDYLNHLVEIYKPNYIWIPKNRISEFPHYNIELELLDYILLKFNEQIQQDIYPGLRLLLTTSGSTGSPKLVRLSKDNITANTESIVEYLNIVETDKAITVLPINYSFGLSIINTHLYKGAIILLTEKSIMEKDFWSFFNKYEASTLSGVPYTFEMLKKLRFFDMDLSSLKTITQAGGKLRVELVKEYFSYSISKGINFFVMYGQTEATARMSYLPPNKCFEKYGSIGVAIPRGAFHLIDEKGEKITSANTQGELVYVGPNVSLGYAEHRIDLIKGDENNKELITGDIAFYDNDGFYYIVGRKKRFIKLFGNRLNLDEIEQIVKHDFRECACVGVDDKLSIYVVNSESIDLKEFKKNISSKLNIHFSAINIIEINEIPKNPSGKIIYSNLI